MQGFMKFVFTQGGKKKERNFKVPRVKKQKKNKKNPIKPKMSKIPSEQG